MGHTIPRIDCWKSSQNGRIWDLQDTPVLDAHPGALYNAYAHALAFSQQCAVQVGGDGMSKAGSLEHEAAGRFVSTASTARDMLEVMEKVGLEKLKYWGFSYGTVLGTTFASMFPGRIDRMVNDGMLVLFTTSLKPHNLLKISRVTINVGNVDAAQYFAGAGTHFLQDTDKVMSAFYYFCHKAGPEFCSFHASSPSVIETRLNKLFQSLKKNPVIVPSPLDSINELPSIISYSDVRRLIASSLYRPLVMFPPLAEALAALEAGDGSPFLNLSGRSEGDPFLCDEGRDKPTPELPDVEGSPHATNAIFCSDQGLQNDTVDSFGVYLEKAIETSKSAGATMASMRLGCVGWAVEAKWRFAGPFTGNTSHPILFIANTADNVTPLISAKQNAKGFPGSALLLSNSYGHTSLSTPSRCTAGYIRRYFQDGTLPEGRTVCDPDLVPFERWNISTKDVNDEGLTEALRELMIAPVPSMDI